MQNIIKNIITKNTMDQTKCIYKTHNKFSLKETKQF